MHATDKDVRLCSLMDLPCLTKWNPIWHDFNYFDYVREAENANAAPEMRCPHCLPTCNGINYDYDISEMTISASPGQIFKRGLL